jgi:hypothetical protein
MGCDRVGYLEKLTTQFKGRAISGAYAVHQRFSGAPKSSRSGSDFHIFSQNEASDLNLSRGETDCHREAATL